MLNTPPSEVLPPSGTCSWCHHSADYHLPKIDPETGKAKYPCTGISGTGCGRYGAGCTDFRGFASGALHL